MHDTTGAAVSTSASPQQRMVRKETLIGALANALIAAGVVWALYAGQERIPLFGTGGGAFGLLPGTFMFTLGLTIGLTLAVRARIRKGAVQRLPDGAGPRLGSGLPANVVVRGLTLAVVAEVILVPLVFGVLWLLAPREWSFAAVMALNVGYFVLLAVLVVPIVVWRALRDRV